MRSDFGWQLGSVTQLTQSKDRCHSLGWLQQTHCESYTPAWKDCWPCYHLLVTKQLCQWHRGGLKGEMGHAGATASPSSPKQMEKRTPRSKGSEQDLVCSLPTDQRQHRELSPSGCCQCQQDLTQHGGSMSPTPEDTFLVPVAGRDTSSNASSSTPISCLEQGSLAGMGLILPSQPWMEDAGKAKWDHCAHALFSLDGSGQGSEFVLFVFISP